MKAYKGKLGLTPISQELAKATPGELQHTLYHWVAYALLRRSLGLLVLLQCWWMLTGGAQV